MPVFWLISVALIGDQLYAALRMRSSFVQTYSPLTTARASILGWIANRCPTSSGGYGRTGGRAWTGTFAETAGRSAAVAGAWAASAVAAAFTERTNRSTSRERGTNRMIMSSSARSPTAVNRTVDRSHGYWLCNTMDQRCSASNSGTSSVTSTMSSWV